MSPTHEEYARQFRYSEGPIPSLTIRRGDRVKFAEDRFWWDVRVATWRYAVLTRPQAFGREGLLYTIIDAAAGVRGPCNQIGQGWGDGSFSDAECTALHAALWNGEREVSHRNHLAARIVAVREKVPA